MEPLVSIYIPTRNRLPLLRRAVDSALGQTYRNIEVIVTNDASTDGTAAWLRHRAEADPRLGFLAHMKPCGAPAARNAAIRHATGTFVTGLDDDDAFTPDRVGAFVDYWTLLESRGVRPACLFAQDILVDEDGTVLRVSRKRSSVMADEMFAGNQVGNQIFAPREHFVRAGLFDESLPAWQDLEFFYRVLERFGEARLLDMATYRHTVTLRPDRISAQERNIRRAFDLVAAKHAARSPQRQKALFLQMFDDYYGISPRLGDWLRFLGWSGWRKGLMRLLRPALGIRHASYAPRNAQERAYGNV